MQSSNDNGQEDERQGGWANVGGRCAVLLTVLCAFVAACDDQNARYDKDSKGNVITKEDKARIDPDDRSEQAERRVDEE